MEVFDMEQELQKLRAVLSTMAEQLRIQNELLAAKDAQIAALTEKIAELTAILDEKNHKKNSGNSSTPPSEDPFGGFAHAESSSLHIVQGEREHVSIHLPGRFRRNDEHGAGKLEEPGEEGAADGYMQGDVEGFRRDIKNGDGRAESVNDVINHVGMAAEDDLHRVIRIAVHPCDLIRIVPGIIP